MKIKCDICGGELKMAAGGIALCKVCGMEHSIERVREMLGTGSEKAEERNTSAQKSIIRPQPSEEIKKELAKIPRSVAEKAEEDLSQSSELDFIIKKKFLTVYIKDYSGSAGRVIVPEGVTDIVNNHKTPNALADHPEIREIIFPKSLISIGENAFEGMPNLKKVIFRSNVIIMSEAFKNCKSLKSVIFENAEYIQPGWGCFEGCESLEDFEIPQDTVFEFTTNLFKGCKSLNRFISPKKSDHQMGEGLSFSVFEGCANLSEVILPDDIGGIHKDAFKNCTSLRSVALHSGNLYDLAIHKDAFAGSSFVPDKSDVCPKCGAKLIYSETDMTCSCCDFRLFEC